MVLPHIHWSLAMLLGHSPPRLQQIIPNTTLLPQYRGEAISPWEFFANMTILKLECHVVVSDSFTVGTVYVLMYGLVDKGMRDAGCTCFAKPQHWLFNNGEDLEDSGHCCSKAYTEKLGGTLQHPMLPLGLMHLQREGRGAALQWCVPGVANAVRSSISL
eukprot:6480209-Amphidinium_carterae.1